MAGPDEVCAVSKDWQREPHGAWVSVSDGGFNWNGAGPGRDKSASWVTTHLNNPCFFPSHFPVLMDLYFIDILTKV